MGKMVYLLAATNGPQGNEVLGVIPPSQVPALVEALGMEPPAPGVESTTGGLYVRAVPSFDSTQVVEQAPVHVARLELRWDGAVVTDEFQDPQRRWLVQGWPGPVAGGEPSAAPDLDVTLMPARYGTTMGFALVVVGTDADAVGEVWKVRRYDCLAQPALTTLQAYTREDNTFEVEVGGVRVDQLLLLPDNVGLLAYGGQQ